MIDLQSQLIFPTHAVAPPGPLPLGSERITLETPTGDTLHGVHIRPRTKGGAGHGVLVIGFAGNAWNSEDALDYLHQLYPGADIIGFHYRGYRPSTGKPSAEALIADSALVYDFAVDRVRAERVVAVGFSIGSGIAAQLAGARKLDGVILVTPFDSLKAVAQQLYPWVPMGLLFQHEIDAAAPLIRARTPAAILAAERDDIIPPARTEALRSKVSSIMYDRTIERAGHNDIYQRSDFQVAMREALKAIAEA